MTYNPYPMSKARPKPAPKGTDATARLAKRLVKQSLCCDHCEPTANDMMGAAEQLCRRRFSGATNERQIVGAILSTYRAAGSKRGSRPATEQQMLRRRLLLTKLDRILVVIAGVVSVIWLTCFKHETPTSIASVPDDYIVEWKSIGNVVPTHEPQK
jgi:hypothetical protein